MAQSVPEASGMEDLVAQLRSAGVYGWEVRRVRETSDQLYLDLRPGGVYTPGGIRDVLCATIPPPGKGR